MTLNLFKQKTHEQFSLYLKIWAFKDQQRQVGYVSSTPNMKQKRNFR